MTQTLIIFLEQVRQNNQHFKENLFTKFALLAHVNPDESEPKSGRLIIFQWKDGKLIQASEKEIKGACFSMTSFNGKIVTTINSTVRFAC